MSSAEPETAYKAARLVERQARVSYYTLEIERLERDHPGHAAIPGLRDDIAEARREIAELEDYLGVRPESPG